VLAYTLDRFGDAEGIALGHRDEPEPHPHEVLVRVHGRSLNYRDLLILNERYPVPGQLGVVPLSDGAGEVVAVGCDVSDLAVGDRVMASYFPRWRDGRFRLELAWDQFGCTRDGMLAEFLLTDGDALVKIPAHLSYEQAATLPCAGLTAWSGLTGGRKLVPGETVLTIGTGGVAMFALQFAKLQGARVIALTSSAQKRALLASHGADHVINRVDRQDWDTVVRELTDGRGVDQVVETGSAETLPKSLASCADDGEVAFAAALGPASLDMMALRGAVCLRRYYVGSRAGLLAMSAAIGQHMLEPLIDTVFGFEEARGAYEYIADRRHAGKVVIGD
jgi:NADPH:quinone reductase-like Zn-dependent oxidoreductase